MDMSEAPAAAVKRTHGYAFEQPVKDNNGGANPPSLILRPLYNGILTSKFEENLPSESIPLSSIVITTSEGEWRMCKGWINDAILPTVLSCVRLMYKASDLDMVFTEFFDRYYESDVDQIKELMSHINFSCIVNKTEHFGFEDLAKILCRLPPSESSNICLNVVFDNELAKIVREDLEMCPELRPFFVAEGSE